MWFYSLISILLGVLTAFTSKEYFYIYGIVVTLFFFLLLQLGEKIPSSYRYPSLFGFLGMGLGIWFASILGNFIEKSSLLKNIYDASPFLLVIIFSGIGFYLGFTSLSKAGGFLSYFSNGQDKEKKVLGSQAKILDTSSIIDGRIIDVCATGFIEGLIMIPKFVLSELQQVADSTDPVKRSRGRKGLNELNRLKQNKAIAVKIIEQDYYDIKEVDHKLIRLAKHKNAALITTDYNLNKIASLEGIKVLNVNELANSLKPIVMTNEEIQITVIKEGKDNNQGIGYLDDGTMVVVDGGKDYLGKELTVVVTSILQTSAGRMIFTQPKITKK